VLGFIELSIIFFGQDKWRNINVTAIWGSRQKAKLALKRDLPTPKLTDNTMVLSTVHQGDAEIVDAKPLAISRGTLQTADSKEPFARLHLL
jgi:myb proto-oncogene protein